MAKKKKEEESEDQPGVHKDLEGFDIKINEFGEITSNLDVEKVNQFLNKNVEDKKLKDRKAGEEEE
jgi:hypothetical protein